MIHEDHPQGQSGTDLQPFSTVLANLLHQEFHTTLPLDPLPQDLFHLQDPLTHIQVGQALVQVCPLVVSPRCRYHPRDIHQDTHLPLPLMSTLHSSPLNMDPRQQAQCQYTQPPTRITGHLPELLYPLTQEGITTADPHQKGWSQYLQHSVNKSLRRYSRGTRQCRVVPFLELYRMLVQVNLLVL